MTAAVTPGRDATPEQEAACERAMDGLEAQADIWADEANLVMMVKNLGKVARGLSDRMPKDVREGFINRLEAQIDAIARQAYLEGFMRGGDSRKAYDEARLAAKPADEGVREAIWNEAVKAVSDAMFKSRFPPPRKNHRYEHTVKYHLIEVVESCALSTTGEPKR